MRIADCVAFIAKTCCRHPRGVLVVEASTGSERVMPGGGEAVLVGLAIFPSGCPEGGSAWRTEHSCDEC